MIGSQIEGQAGMPVLRRSDAKRDREECCSYADETRSQNLLRTAPAALAAARENTFHNMETCRIAACHFLGRLHGKIRGQEVCCIRPFPRFRTCWSDVAQGAQHG